VANDRAKAWSLYLTMQPQKSEGRPFEPKKAAGQCQFKSVGCDVPLGLAVDRTPVHNHLLTAINHHDGYVQERRPLPS
jgi:hypothetical protein